MNRIPLIVTSLLTAGTLALPVAAIARDAQGPYGLIDYKMGIARPQQTEAPVEETVIIPVPGTRDSSFSQYGLVDLKSGLVPVFFTSDGTAPVSSDLTRATGLAQNASAAEARGAVITADGGAIGTIDHVVPGTTSDTVFVRVSNDVKDRTVSMFRIDVPKGAIHDHMLRLGWTMSGLLDRLHAQA